MKAGMRRTGIISLFIVMAVLVAAVGDASAVWKYNVTAGTRTCAGTPGTTCSYLNASGQTVTVPIGTTIQIGAMDPPAWVLAQTLSVLQDNNPNTSRTYDVSRYFLEVTGTLTSDKITINNEAMVTLNAGSTLQFASTLSGGGMNNLGVLRGAGTFAGGLVNYGLVSPGLSPGTLTINGNFINTDVGTMLFELGSSAYDILNITGTASLNGVLDVDPYGIFNPHIGDTFRIMTWASYTGQFAEIDFSDLPGGPESWTYAYDAGGMTLTYHSVPEPSTLLLLGFGLAGLVAGRKRHA